MKKDLSDREISLEGRMGKLGVERYKAKWDRAVKTRQITTTASGQYLLREATEVLTHRIEEWMSLESKRVAAHQNKALKHLQRFPSQLVAHLSVKAILDRLLRPESITACVRMIGSRLEDEARFTALALQNPAWWERLRNATRRAGYNHLRRTAQVYTKKSGTDFEPWSRCDKATVGMVLYQLILETTGFITEHHYVRKHGAKYRKAVQVLPSPSILQWLENSNEAYQELRPFWMPMVDPPGDWKSVRGGGYRLEEFQRPLVMSRFLEELDAAGVGDVLDAVNVLQKVPWVINRNSWETLEYFWELGGGRGCFPLREDPVVPERPEDIDTNDLAKREWRTKAHAVYTYRATLRSRRLLAIKTVVLAKEFRDESFYFPYQADFRGRIYPVPFFLQPQGPSLARGLLSFANGHHMERGGTAEKWLQIHGANCWGEDKITLEARQQWVRDHEKEILEVYRDPASARWWEEADAPHQFLAFCLEYGELVEEGSVESHVPVMIDGSNNGLQIFSLLMRDRMGAVSTNVAPTDTPQDLYREVADIVTEKLKVSEDPMAARWLAVFKGKVTRDVTKRPVMTLPYGVTLYSVQKYIREWYTEEVGTEAFGAEIYKPCYFLAKVIWESIEVRVGFAKECMTWLRTCAKIIAKEGKAIRWTSPSGFPVVQWRGKPKRRRVKSRIGEVVRWGQYSVIDGKVDSARMVAGIAPNFVHSLDAACLAMTVKRAAEAGITDLSVIHDSFGCPAPQMEALSKIIREVYAEVFSEDLLNQLVSQLRLGVTKPLPDPPELGDFDPREVLKSTYLFS
jgi:DNA-directed RNA polymerase, mitochondrial